MKLTKTIVDKLEHIPGKTQTFYRDNDLKGFALRITSGGVKSFIVETRINGKVKRVTSGKYGNLTVEEARKQAKSLLGSVARGDDPIAEKKTKKVHAMTLQQVLNDYLKARKDLKPPTLNDYQCVLHEVVPDWLDKPLVNITREMIAKRHTKHGQANSKALANNAMRVLRAIFNFAMYEYQDGNGHPIITINPVKYLSHTRAWYRVDRKQTVIKPHQLADWYKAVIILVETDNYRNALLWHDYFLLLLFTGMRKMEAASLRWEDIDLKSKTITLQDTKNHEIHTLPMSDFVFELMERRSRNKTSEFVFPAESKTGYIYEPKKAVNRVVELSGVPFTLHDLRRTFATIADSLDLPAYALKRLLNHKMNNDVTAGYIMKDVERLRKPMQQLANFILEHMMETAEL
ncbi:TPA: tyrosine-type recombinase/integrase [Legionella pneumophila]|nr:tyrosine-type recombinase/integrase [Legionella pneumophila]HAT8868576.1 tyrosine-type recombinase/integrase [Legionella pneumophila subsp. pneumophila]HAT8889795.1 tyrosine-type recombinase/integrase [Legionella pneumophila subsp. pneumophila]HAT8931936.1 tyrosine-type recombinase/integrase [Legionella pneumophila subsp. pneumophila]HAU0161030.1 tyrosine-type recombinase/integrase [Legionella pneumophila]